MGRKVITFSFDDGVEDDIRLVEMFNKYGIKSTFNLNSGQLTCDVKWRYRDQKDVIRLNYYDSQHLYDGHEIACHSYTHPHLENMEKEDMDNQIRLDKYLLERLYGGEMRGMAYPFGTYNDTVIEVLREIGMEYGRTTKSTYDFKFPEEPLTWHPTCRFTDEKRMELAQAFFDAEAEEDMLFYIWGHSYELITEEDWAEFEAFCEFISGREDILYCTNIEALDLKKRNLGEKNRC